MFNSADVAWANITVVMNGRPLIGIRGISYKAMQEKEFLHAAGTAPLGIQHGNETYEGEIKLLKVELDALQAEARRQGLSSIKQLTGDIVVTYSVTRNTPLITDRIKRFEIKEYQKGMEQNAKFMEISLPIMFLALEENV